MNLQTYLRKALRQIDKLDHPEPLWLNLQYHRILADCADKALHHGNAIANEVLSVDEEQILHPQWVKQLLAEAIGTCKEPTPSQLTAAQAAERLNISTRKVYQLCERNKLAHTKNPIRISLAAVQQFGQPSKPLRHIK